MFSFLNSLNVNVIVYSDYSVIIFIDCGVTFVFRGEWKNTFYSKNGSNFSSFKRLRDEQFRAYGNSGTKEIHCTSIGSFTRRCLRQLSRGLVIYMTH